MTRKELLKLPETNLDNIKTYRSLYVIPTGKKHDSGYALMAIIGCERYGKPLEIAAYCDDICWIIKSDGNSHSLRNDMKYPSGIIHYWSSEFVFQVHESYSSTDIMLTSKKVFEFEQQHKARKTNQ